MECGAALARLVAGGHEIVPRRKLSAQFALRQLEQQRRDRLTNRVQVVGSRKTLACPEVSRVQAVQVLIPALLVRLEVTVRVERDPPVPAPLGVDSQRDLLRHRPRGHPDRCLFPEQLRDARFQPFNERPFAVNVDLSKVRRTLCQRKQRRPRIAVAWLESPNYAVALSPDSP